jgi:primosomal protein N' (replication factor Y)
MYEAPEDLAIGQIVHVPFGRRSALGVLWEEATGPAPSPIKSITGPCSPYILQEPLRQFLAWVSRYTMAPIGSVLKRTLGALKDPENPSQKMPDCAWPTHLADFPLSKEQETVVPPLLAAVQEAVFHPFFLDGVTGSGKTEVYLHAARKAILEGRQVLILLPEIALTGALVARCEEHLGCSSLLWHSGQTPAQKRKNWHAIASGQAALVIGARSALFLPFQRLGFVVVDEEHDTSYKQEEGGFYHARDMAVVRARCEAIPVVLASATPSLETFLNAQEGRYTTLSLPRRYKEAPFPSVQCIDLRKHAPSGDQSSCLSPVLIQKIRETLSRHEQVLLYINRRGYAPITLCRTCGEKIACPNCTTFLVEHRQRGLLLCHYCGHTIARPSACPSCTAETLSRWGIGVEQVAEEAQRLFPEAVVALASSDTLSTPRKMQQLTQRIHDGEISLIVGTRILAKGHHFPNLTCVGIVDADYMLSAEDIRAREYAFQLLHQVAGRAGRAEKPGQVFLQTYAPEQPLFRQLLERDAFLREEAQWRKSAKMPPFVRLAALIFSGLCAEEVERCAGAFVKQAPLEKRVDILGPIPAPLSYLRGRHRWRALVRAPRHYPLSAFLERWRGQVPLPKICRLEIDIDPTNFL